MFPQEPKVPQISATEVKLLIDDKEEMILLDVRTGGEYSRGTIGASINVPVDQVSEKVEKILSDKNAKIIVFCLSGSRSVYAVEIMRKMGYKHVLNMTNGLLAWRAMVMPIF